MNVPGMISTCMPSSLYVCLTLPQHLVCCIVMSLFHAVLTKVNVLVVLGAREAVVDHPQAHPLWAEDEDGEWD